MAFYLIIQNFKLFGTTIVGKTVQVGNLKLVVGSDESAVVGMIRDHNDILENVVFHSRYNVMHQSKNLKSKNVIIVIDSTVIQDKELGATLLIQELIKKADNISSAYAELRMIKRFVEVKLLPMSIYLKKFNVSDITNLSIHQQLTTGTITKIAAEATTSAAAASASSSESSTRGRRQLNIDDLELSSNTDEYFIIARPIEYMVKNNMHRFLIQDSSSTIEVRIIIICIGEVENIQLGETYKFSNFSVEKMAKFQISPMAINPLYMLFSETTPHNFTSHISRHNETIVNENIPFRLLTNIITEQEIRIGRKISVQAYLRATFKESLASPNKIGVFISAKMDNGFLDNHKINVPIEDQRLLTFVKLNLGKLVKITYLTVAQQVINKTTGLSQLIFNTSNNTDIVNN